MFKLIINKIFNLLGKITILLLLLLISLIIFIDNNFFESKTKIYSNLPNFELRKYIFKKDSKVEHFNNDYNVKFLPKTQFENLKFKRKKIKFSDEYFANKLNFAESTSYKRYGTFFIDFYLDNLILTDYLGNFYFLKNLTESIKSNQDLNLIYLKSNIDPKRIYDTFIHNENIYVSFTLEKNGCNTINIMSAKINKKVLKFKNFFNSKKCNKTGSPGKMQFIKIDGKEGLLLSTSEGVSDKPGTNTQNVKSIFGKILFIPFDKNDKFSIFSLGHRVIQGLNVRENEIIATEHGPKGGDEINNILKNKNYGWPIASYGERYDFQYKNKKINYKKNHKENNFKEPIFSFIPSIGISDIINLPKNFSIFYDDHYVLSSLNGRSLYFIKFNENLEKIITNERVFIGQRIRDLKYFKKEKTIILALEEKGELGFLIND